MIILKTLPRLLESHFYSPFLFMELEKFHGEDADSNFLLHHFCPNRITVLPMQFLYCL